MKIITAEQHHAAMLSTFATKTFYDAWKEFNTEEDMQLFVMQHFTPEIISKEIDDASQIFLLAIHKQTLAGYLKLKSGKPVKYDLEGTCFEIEKLYVDKDLQNQQTGTLLLKDAERVAKERKADTLWLSVWKPNARGIKFYERNGFSIFGEQEFILGKDLQYDFLMRKDLV